MNNKDEKKMPKIEFSISGFFKRFDPLGLKHKVVDVKMKQPSVLTPLKNIEEVKPAEAKVIDTSQLPGHAIVALTRVSEPRKPERVSANPDMEWVFLPLSSKGYLLPPNPTGDSITHINVNIRSETELGRMLSHFYYSPFEHPMYGKFSCIEAFWQWIKSKERPEAIRTMSAANAKKEGHHLDKRKVPMFYEVIADANYLRIVQNVEIYEALVQSELPFDTYYRNPAGMPTRPQDCVKMIKQFEQCREWLKTGVERPALDYDFILHNDAP